MHPPSAPASPLPYYRQLVENGEITADPGQLAVMERLQCLYERVIPRLDRGISGNTHKPQEIPQSSRGMTILQRLFSKKAPPPQSTSGIYIWGDVGRGKSMVMDMFYDSIHGIPKQRIHFHAFMREVHARMHAWRQLKADDDLLPRVVREMAQGFRLLCLDELQVHDITDAMIISRLFTQLFELGVTVVFTSNRPPADLYQGGIQRELFQPFIALVKERMEVLELVSPTDYRLEQLRAMKQTYIHPLGPEAEERLYDIYCALTHGHESVPIHLSIQGRQLLVEKTAHGVAWMTFQELCERPLGAGDYIELANVFHTLLVQDIPILIPEKRNEAKRFVTLIDALYEHKVKFICSAAADPESLYPKGDGSFEFHRTVSRLIEMQSESYLGAEHVVD